jgi:hypothetical protein
MTERTIDLDQHRGMAAQKATDLRRLLADVYRGIFTAYQTKQRR